MLRLFFNFNGEILKVRLAGAAEAFEHSVNWKNRIEFSFQETSIMMMSWTSMLPDLKSKDAEALLDLASARYPLSHDYSELSRLCPQLVVGKDNEEWVFYGGTFDPWHEGHQACLNLLPEELCCYVLPDNSPHKDLRTNDSVPTIIGLASRIKFKKHQFLVPTFLMDHKKNPTVEWIERLTKHFKEKKFSLLIGYDSLASISTWTHSEKLLPMLHTLYVASRLEKDGDREGIVSELRKTAPDLKIVFLGRHQFEGVSSTKIRKTSILRA